jgi:putative transposase
LEESAILEGKTCGFTGESLENESCSLVLALPMPRSPRIYIPDVSLHVFHRGINHDTIVRDEFDHEQLLRLIVRATVRHGVGVHAFALMRTHYHLVVTPPDEGILPRTMQKIGVGYTRYFNRKYGRIGTMWNERYSAILLDDERYCYNCLRYVDLNPFAAHVVSAPEDYRWSSYRVHALGEACEWLTPHPLYLALGPTAGVRQTAYRAMCAVPLTEAELTLQRRPPPPAVERLPVVA